MLWGTGVERTYGQTDPGSGEQGGRGDTLESLGLPAVSQIHAGQQAERPLLRTPSTFTLPIISFCKSSSGERICRSSHITDDLTGSSDPQLGPPRKAGEANETAGDGGTRQHGLLPPRSQFPPCTWGASEIAQAKNPCPRDLGSQKVLGGPLGQYGFSRVGG